MVEALLDLSSSLPVVGHLFSPALLCMVIPAEDESDQIVVCDMILHHDPSGMIRNIHLQLHILIARRRHQRRLLLESFHYVTLKRVHHR